MSEQKKQDKKGLTFMLKSVLCASLAASMSEVTLPFDTSKVRLFVQGDKDAGQAKYKGVFGTMRTVAQDQGVLALYNGFIPAVQRQIVFAGLRIGLYEKVRNFYSGELKEGEMPSLLTKIKAGLTTGAIGITVANPTDVVKIRLQAQGQPGKPIRYNGTLDAYRKILAEEGYVHSHFNRIKGFWTGWLPNVCRNSVFNAAELATYDQVKQILVKKMQFPDNVLTHFFCGFWAGVMAVIVGNPIDVIKTRLMNKTVFYKNGFDCFYKILSKEGPFAFYKGWTINIMRLASFNVCIFVFMEQWRKIILGSTL